MKKYILSVLFCVLGLSHLQADNISVPDVTIEPGQSATVAISLNNTEANLVSFQMDLTLPTGISINKSGCALSSRFTDEDQELTIGKQGTNVYRLTSTSFALTPISGTSGEIITLSLTASNNSEGGTATISNIRFVTSLSGKVLVSDASFNITVETPSLAITFADANVKAICVANWDTNGDGKLSEAEAAAVTSLGTVFKDNTEITSFDEISYFTGLTGFEDDAFNGCSGLTSFTIPSNITSIGRRAFQSCSGLTSITIPASVTDIYNHAFTYCTGITSITVESGNSVYDSRNDCNAIIKTKNNQLVKGCKNTVIPNSVTRIGMYSFMGCTGLTSITIPEAVTAIGASAFHDCTDLTSIAIPNSVTSIESATFRYCNSLTGVTVDIPTPLAINENVFSNRANATLYVPVGSKADYEAADYWKEFKAIVEYGNITFADANVKTLCVANWDTNGDGELSVAEAAAVTSLGEVFKGNTEITSFDELQYFTGLTTIDTNAFDLCSQLASVVLPPNITSVDYESFKGTALTSVVVPEGVTEIIDRGFADCTSMVSVTLPSTLTTLRQGAFINCPKLESISLPKSITKIGLAAFRGCRSLNSIDLSGMTVTIDAEAFMETGLEELTIPATVTLTGWTNFGWCNSLKTVTVECEGELPNDIFKACAQLETAVLPSASAMKWGSFIDCPKLKSITFTSGDAGDVPYFRNFAGTPDDVLFNVPSGTAESFLMKGYWNLPDLSALPTVKAEFEAETVAIETMADGINDGDKTTLANAISEARAAVTNADSYASVLEQLAAIKAAAKIFIAGATLTENTDITAATITNAYFNNFTIGWKHGWAQSGTYSTENIINGDVAMDKFIEAWDPSEGNLYSQTIKSLPAGIYRLEADIVTNPLDAAEVEGVSLFAGKSQTDVVTGTNQPQHFSLQFNNNIVGDCMVGIRIAATNSVNYVAMDNVRLYYVDSAETLYASASSEHPIDVTSFIINPSFVDNNADGWEGSTPLFQSYNNAEFYQTTFDIHQTISGLPNGNYLLKVKGFHRPGQNQDVFTSYNEGTNNARAELYANTESTTLENQARYAQDSQAYGGASVTYNNETSYVPNSMQDARSWFDAGYYENELPVTVTDGTLTIGIRLDESVGYGWVVFDEFQLAFLGQEQQSIVEMVQLYPIDHTANRGAEFDLPILMENGEEAITAFQFDVELPEGITLLSAKLSDRKADQGNPVPTLQSDGSYRLATFSSSGSAFSGSEGMLLNLRVKVSTDATLGEHTVTLKNIEMTTTSKAFELINHSSTITVLDVLAGDASGDGKVSIFDAVQIVNYILGNTPETFIESAADVDGNGKITIFDAVSTVNIILNQGSTNNARMTKVDNEFEPQ